MLIYICLFVSLMQLARATSRPIIGILAQEIEADDPNRLLNYTSYLAASYVKAVEAAGARALPVFIRRDIDYYEETASKVNGFLFTGGSSDLLSHYGVARSGKLVLDQVLKLNKQGVNIPILGVCQGFELLAILSNGWNPILAKCRVENEALSIQMVGGYGKSSLYKGASADDMYTLTHSPSTANHHSSCLTAKNLTLFNLTQWQVLSTSRSRQGYVFVSSMEWKSLPVAAVQFHPEKSSYEWKPGQANPHDAKSIRAARLFYDWLVAQSRRNNNSFLDVQEEQDSLIYNYSPVYTGKQDGYDTQNYYFIDPPGNLENDLHYNFHSTL